MSKDAPTISRLDDQIGWYDIRSQSNQKWYKRFKITEIICAILIPFLAGFKVHPFIIGGLGALVSLIEALIHFLQLQHNWISYRSTCESLKHEKFLYLANAGPYSDPQDAQKILAEKIESLISKEHAQWIKAQNKASKRREES